jgi:hypothetical protein
MDNSETDTERLAEAVKAGAGLISQSVMLVAQCIVALVITILFKPMEGEVNVGATTFAAFLLGGAFTISLYKISTLANRFLSLGRNK